ncbi:MAG TPA: fructose-6-phosphate aldolase [Eubacteriaceae bacterium]|jgi:fructose-6-phosphate aldolase 2|nr:fructose-6-phosphate aldolase [Eubacteriaceae bacterium]
MRILLDTANINEIKRGIEYYAIEGVTTNPSIIVKEKVDFISHMSEIAKLLGRKRKLFIQTIATDAEGIVDDALLINELVEGNLCVKIPVTSEGLKAIKILKEKGVDTAATSIINSQQGLLAARGGAKYLIPYVNRADNILADGVNTVGEIVDFIDIYGLDCEVVAASFKNIQQVHGCALNRVHAVTIPADLLDKLSFNHLTDFSVEEFSNNWDKAYPGIKNIRSMVKK